VAISIQTNVNSLVAQENLRVNTNFQSQTIQRLTSGYRINSSGDDAAGLAIANKYRSDTAELTQGVRNANDGVSNLQVIDGGMNNISKMLDRLRTLATQSASATFTDAGRVVANSEFQSLLTEIDRQAKSIGLDTNGQFAKTLSVFIGGGKAAGTGAIDTSNGTVSVDLSKSATDTRALGLKGLQVVGGTADIGNSSSTHTVQAIVNDSANKLSTQTPGFSNLYFAGPGFSDGSKVKVAVNTTGVSDINTLVAAVNNAISDAGNGTSQPATQFKAAGIVASVVTDSNGQHLAFNSSTTAFQVEAGDQMANAFLGNITSGSTGNALGTTVTGGATEASVASISHTIASADAHSQSLTVTVDGNATVVAIQAGSGTIGAAATDINTVGATNGFSAAYANGALTITATGAGAHTISVSNAPGQTGATTLGINNATASNGFSAANVTLQITGAGLTTPKLITFSNASTTVDAAIAELSNKVSTDTDLKAAGITMSGSSGSPLVFSNSRGEQFQVQVTGDTKNALGLGAFTTNVSSGNFAADYTSIQNGSAYTGANNYGTANLEFSVNGSSTASNRVSVDLSAGDATATVMTAANAANVDGGKMSIAVAGGTLNSGAVEVDFGADVAAFVGGNTATGAAGKSLTIDLDGVQKTVNFAAATGASATTSGTPTWADAATQTLTWTTGGSDVANGSVTFAANAATGASVTSGAGADYAGALGKTLTYSTDAGSTTAGSVTFTGAAATGTTIASGASADYAGAAGKALTYSLDNSTVAGTINFTAAAATGASVTSGASADFAGAAGKALTYSLDDGSTSATINITANAATGAHATVAAGPFSDVNGQTLTWDDNAGDTGTFTFTSAATDNYAVAAQLKTDLFSTAIDVTVDGSGALQLTNTNTGASTHLDFSGTAAHTLGLAVDDTTVNSYSNGADAQVLTGADVAGQITTKSGGDLTAAIDGSGNLVVTRTSTGSANHLQLGGAAAGAGTSLLKLSTSNATNGTDTQVLTADDIAAQITAQAGTNLSAKVVGGALQISTVATGAGANSQLKLGGAAAGAGTTFLKLAVTNQQTGTDAQVLTAYDVAAQITAHLGAALDAKVVGGNLVVTNKTTGAGAASQLELGGTAAGGGTTFLKLAVTNQTNGTAAGSLTADDIAAQINNSTAGAHINAKVTGGELVITNKSLGLAQTMTLSGAAALTSIGTVAAGADGDNTLTKVIAAIAAQDGRVTAADDLTGNLKITDNTAFTGTNHVLTLGNGTGAAATALGLSTSPVTSVHGSDTATQQAAIINGTTGIEVTADVNSSGKLVLTAKDKGAHAITLAPVAVGMGVPVATTALGFTTTSAGAGRSAQSVVDLLNNKFAQDPALQKAGLTASQTFGTITLSSSNNTFFRLGTSTSGANADLGFGVSSSTAQFGGVTATQSKLSSSDAGGASATNAISFAALANGSDDQALTVSANDPTGALQSMTILLKNDKDSSGNAVRNGRSIDEAVNYINTQLQQSSNSTLQKIVAVKEQLLDPTTKVPTGAEGINFISSLGSFKVGLGSSANGNGLNTGTAATEQGNIVGSGSNVSIDSLANALSAVTALSSAVTTLGNAQAAVGKGQNQLNYAIGLASSQISSFSAAESRIRDTDVAAEAANLTKAQVLQQASMAAMAQANSAPQAVMTLLRG
jgi:flagellin